MFGLPRSRPRRGSDLINPIDLTDSNTKYARAMAGTRISKTNTTRAVTRDGEREKGDKETKNEGG